MTEFVEGPIEAVTHWKDDKGGNIVLKQNSIKIYFEGKLNLSLGKLYRFELVLGTGEHEGEYEYVGAKELVANIAAPPPGATGIAHIPVPQLREIMKSRMSLEESRVRALDNAVKVYVALGRGETDLKIISEEVMEIAAKFEKYLL